jgi:hypothetical protein
VVVYGGSTMASMVVQLCQSGGGGKRVAPLGGALFIASGGGWQRRRELRVQQWRQLCHGQGKATVAMVQTRSARAVPLFGQGA